MTFALLAEYMAHLGCQAKLDAANARAEKAESALALASSHVDVLGRRVTLHRDEWAAERKRAERAEEALAEAQDRSMANYSDLLDARRRTDRAQGALDALVATLIVSGKCSCGHPLRNTVGCLECRTVARPLGEPKP